MCIERLRIEIDWLLLPLMAHYNERKKKLVGSSKTREFMTNVWIYFFFFVVVARLHMLLLACSLSARRAK
jgi:ABC-type lipoprotein release transport system permease subunit